MGKSMVDFEIEDIQFEQAKGVIKTLKLPKLSESEKNIIDPIVAPTSGLRIQIYDEIEENEKYFLPNKKFFLFLEYLKLLVNNLLNCVEIRI